MFLALLAGLPPAGALTPLPDTTPGFFAGEWAGAGEQGGYCYMTLDVDGSGVVLIDGGSGDWLGARMRWHNERQALVVDRVLPMPFSAQHRVMPLPAFTIRSGLNQSLGVSWSARALACQMQKIDAATRHLEQARSALQSMNKDAGKR
jgi:hypothetical protein